MMKRTIILMLASTALLGSICAQAQVAGSTVLGVAAVELRQVTMGWSAKHQVLGKAVFNDKNERIGTVDDIVIAPDKAVSYAIIGAGGVSGALRSLVTHKSGPSAASDDSTPHAVPSRFG